MSRTVHLPKMGLRIVKEVTNKSQYEQSRSDGKDINRTVGSSPIVVPFSRHFYFYSIY